MSSNVDGAISSVNKLILSVEKLNTIISKLNTTDLTNSIKSLENTVVKLQDTFDKYIQSTSSANQQVSLLSMALNKVQSSLSFTSLSSKLFDEALDSMIETAWDAIAAFTRIDKRQKAFVKNAKNQGNEFRKSWSDNINALKTSWANSMNNIKTGWANSMNNIKTGTLGAISNMNRFRRSIAKIKPLQFILIGLAIAVIVGLVWYLVKNWDNLAPSIKNTIILVSGFVGVILGVVGAIKLLSLGMTIFNTITGMSPIVFIIITAIGVMILLFTYIENILGVWNNWMDSMRNSGGIWEFIAECLDNTIGTFLRAIDSVKKHAGGILGNLFGKDNKVQVTTEDNTLQNTVTKISPMPAPIEPMNTHTNRINNIDMMSGNSLISPSLANSLPTQNMNALDIMGMENNDLLTTNLDMNYTNSNPIQSISNTQLSTNMQSQKVTNTKASNKNTTFNIQKLSIGSKNMKSADDITNIISRGVMA